MMVETCSACRISKAVTCRNLLICKEAYYEPFSKTFDSHLFPFQIFDDKFIEDLISMLENGEGKEDQELVDNFQPTQLCTQLKIMKALEDDTDYKHKTLRENEVNLIDVEPLRRDLKDRQHGNDFISDFEEGRKRMEQYIKAVEREIAKRRQVVELLTQVRY